MNANYIKQLIKLVEESDIDSLEVSSWGRKVRIVQRATASNNGSGQSVAVVPAVSATQPAPASPAPAPTPAVPTTPPAEDIGNLVEVKSPMVGTFYTAPSPEADSYVSINEKVSVGQVLCIVEAMKLMNEIESEVSGRVVRIMIENAQPVEFGQVLFLIDPS